MSDQDTQEEVLVEGEFEENGKTPKRKQRWSKNKRISKVLELAAKDVSKKDIADNVGLARSTVESILEQFAPVFQELKNVREYRQGKNDLLAAGQLAALKSAFSGNKLNKAGFLSTLQGFEILNKAERLESGQSTENHAHSFLGKLSIADE